MKDSYHILCITDSDWRPDYEKGIKQFKRTFGGYIARGQVINYNHTHLFFETAAKQVIIIPLELIEWVIPEEEANNESSNS